MNIYWYTKSILPLDYVPSFFINHSQFDLMLFIFPKSINLFICELTKSNRELKLLSFIFPKLEINNFCIIIGTIVKTKFGSTLVQKSKIELYHLHMYYSKPF